MNQLLTLIGCLVCSWSAFAVRITDLAIVPNQLEAGTDFQTITVKFMQDNEDPQLKLMIRAFHLGDKTNTIDLKAEAIITKPEFAVGEKVVQRQQSFKILLADMPLPQGEVRVGYVAIVKSAATGEQLGDYPSEIQTISVEGKNKRVIERFRNVFDEAKLATAIVVKSDGSVEHKDSAVEVFPSTEEDGSITAEKLKEQNDADAIDNPRALAEIRAPAGQPLATDSNLVYFATNRKLVSMRDGSTQFFPEVRAKGIPGLSWGYVNISLPTRNQEQSYWSSVKAKMDKPKFFPNESGFLEKIAHAKSQDIFLFIHGYCNSFEDAILQAGRMKRDTNFKGNVMAFSWPSAGKIDPISYDRDQGYADDQDSLKAFDYVLQRVVKRAQSQRGQIYVLAHSMGNRFLVHGLRSLYLEQQKEEQQRQKDLLAKGIDPKSLPKPVRPISVAAFAAPDVDIDAFYRVVPNISELSDQTSFYYSTKDRALSLAELRIGRERAGLFPIFNDVRFATVNTDKLKSWFSMGHTYYGGADRSILDLTMQFAYHMPADKRVPPLEADKKGEETFQFKHWYLTPL